MMRAIKLMVPGTAVVGAAVASQDPGAVRSATFWSVAFPIFLRYRWHEYITVRSMTDEEADASWNQLHDKYAPEGEALTLKMKGFYLKNAQFISTLSEDFLPRQYMDWMKRTQDAVPTPFEEGQARTTIEKSLGASIDEVFSSFEEKPIGAASIGQVHRATLHDGKRVVVKVQYPGVEAMFRSDLATITTFCRIAMPQHVQPMEEIEKQFVTEFDYVGEANNMQEMHDNLMPIWGDKIMVPRPIKQVAASRGAVIATCTKDVLTMEEVPGVALVPGIRNNYRKMADLQGTTLEAMEEDQKRQIRKGTFRLKDTTAEAHKINRAKTMIWASDAVKNCGRTLYNYTAGLVFGQMAYAQTETPINLAEVLELLSEVHAYQIFIDGVFNGDPHPGNVMLLPDGRLGLIDYGQVKRWTLPQRKAYAELIIALDNVKTGAGSKEEVVRAFHDELHMCTRDNNPDILYRLATFWNDDMSDEITLGKNLQEFQDWAEAEDPQVSIPNWPVMAARVSILMRGMGNAFGLHLTTARTWAPYARRLIEECGPARGTAVDVD